MVLLPERHQYFCHICKTYEKCQNERPKLWLLATQFWLAETGQSMSMEQIVMIWSHVLLSERCFCSASRNRFSKSFSCCKVLNTWDLGFGIWVPRTYLWDVEIMMVMAILTMMTMKIMMHLWGDGWLAVVSQSAKCISCIGKMLEGTPKYIISLYCTMLESAFFLPWQQMCAHWGLLGLSFSFQQQARHCTRMQSLLVLKPRVHFLPWQCFHCSALGNAWLAQLLDYELCGSTLPRSLH